VARCYYCEQRFVCSSLTSTDLLCAAQGKGLDWGGSHIRPEATGYGTCYYVDHMIKHNEGAEAGFKGKKVVISGSGQVAQFAALKIMELGGTVLSLSDSKGVLISTDAAGYQKEWIKEVFDIKVNKKELSTLGDKGGKLKFVEGARPWKTVESYDVALPCATQNEVDESDAKAMIEKGCRYVGEGELQRALWSIEHC
jgi:glutamate dehydrogenase (NADP+)